MVPLTSTSGLSEASATALPTQVPYHCYLFYSYYCALSLCPQAGSGPVPPKLVDKGSFISPTIGELRAIGIGTKTATGMLDLLVYCPLKGRCPHCKSALIVASNSVGKRKLCYTVPWPKSIVGIDMRCKKCKKHFMTHDPLYVNTLSSEDEVKRDFVSGKGNCTHMSVTRMLR